MSNIALVMTSNVYVVVALSTRTASKGDQDGCAIQLCDRIFHYRCKLTRRFKLPSVQPLISLLPPRLLFLRHFQPPLSKRVCMSCRPIRRFNVLLDHGNAFT